MKDLSDPWTNIYLKFAVVIHARNRNDEKIVKNPFQILMLEWMASAGLKTMFILLWFYVGRLTLANWYTFGRSLHQGGHLHSEEKPVRPAQFSEQCRRKHFGFAIHTKLLTVP